MRIHRSDTMDFVNDLTEFVNTMEAQLQDTRYLKHTRLAHLPKPNTENDQIEQEVEEFFH